MRGFLIIFIFDFFIILSVSDPFYETTTKITELTKRFSFFSSFRTFSELPQSHSNSENYENFEIYENISVMLLFFLYVSVILHRQRDWITEKNGNDRKNGNLCIPYFRTFSSFRPFSELPSSRYFIPKTTKISKFTKTFP